MSWERLNSTWYCVVDDSDNTIIEHGDDHFFRDVSKAKSIKQKQEDSDSLEIWVLEKPEELD